MIQVTDEQELVDFLKKFSRLFNLVRVVDPIGKKVLSCESRNGFAVAQSSCFDFWKNNTFCLNCVSSMAIAEDDTFLKIEYNKEKVFMVFTSPIVLSGRKYVVEILKDITETGIIPGLKGKTTEEIYDMIESLNREVITDGLTQVFNRKYIDQRLPVDIYNAAANRVCLSAIMLDVDRFKEINDTYGHPCGDLVLQKTARIIESCIRDGDWISRYGGDEFLVVLPGASHDTARKISEDIRRKAERGSFEYNGADVSFTVSIGSYTVASMDTGPIPMERLLTLADQMMYRAKKSRKNKITD